MPLTQVKTSNLDTTNSLFFRNRIINGDMRIDQRNAGNAGTPAGSGDYASVDRWAAKGLIQSSKFTMQRITGSAPAGFSHYLACVPAANTTVASGDSFYIQHTIEGYNIQDLNWGTASAIPVTVSFWVKSNLTGTFGGFLYGSSHSVPFSYTISASATWEYKTVTIATPPVGSTWNLDNDYGITIGWNFGSGATYQATPGTWVSGYNGRAPTGQVNIMASTSNYFYITGVQLEVGTAATSFERRPYTTELQLCQRYYEKCYPQNIVPGTSGYQYAEYTTCTYNNNTGYIESTFKFQVMKRAAPTMTAYDSAGNSGRSSYYVSGSLSNDKSITFGGAGPTDYKFYFYSDNTTSKGGMAFGWTASAEL